MTLDRSRLWAKSCRKDETLRESMYLHQHLKDVHRSAMHVVDSTGVEQLAALGLDHAMFFGRLKRCVLLAAAAHDLGKANDHFQGMITLHRNVQQNPQGLRHEWAAILILQSLKPWLLPALADSDTDFAIVEWAVAGHHPAHDHASPPRSGPGGSGTTLRLQMGHSDFASILGWLQAAFDLDAPPELRDVQMSLIGRENVFLQLAQWQKAQLKIWDRIRLHDAKLVAAVKDCLVAADVAGSALPKHTDAPKCFDWITESFHAKPKQRELQKVVDERSKSFTSQDKDREDFQNAVADSRSPVTYIKAGCGSGKTQAAYRWAANQHPTRRLYFCYPTTGTATEGFKDYLAEPDVNSDLFHSRSDIDREIILAASEDSKFSDLELAMRHDALAAWSTPIVACTVDTVLGIVQNNKRGLFAWPALAQSAFVFDEIHAYDDALFGALLRFLGDLPGLPALLMTASLPTAREEALQAMLRKYRNIELARIEGPKSLEERFRYHNATAPGLNPLALAQEAFKRDEKVLWVCNTVSRVMQAAAAAEAKGLKPLLYHSRFKYRDRVKRHKAVIDAFKATGAAFAICSQVAEMSLDLSADLLVTDVAPVPALIQRLGRLNRYAVANSQIKPFIVIEPDNNLPYTLEDLESARTWLKKLPADGISQAALAKCWEQTGDQPPNRVPSAWFDGGPTTNVRELREASQGITVLVDCDVKPQMSSKDVTAYTLPMPPPPRHLDWRIWKKVRGIPVAPTEHIDYDTLRGAQWRK